MYLFVQLLQGGIVSSCKKDNSTNNIKPTQSISDEDLALANSIISFYEMVNSTKKSVEIFCVDDAIDLMEGCINYYSSNATEEGAKLVTETTFLPFDNTKSELNTNEHISLLALTVWNDSTYINISGSILNYG